MHGFSCGSNPSGVINPWALEVLTDLGYETTSMRSKSWDEFTDSDVKIDICFTVCDAAAGEACPVFFGAPLKIYWGLSDPSVVVDLAERKLAFLNTANIIKSNLEKLKNILDNHSKDDLLSLKGEIQSIHGW
tara:strand:- start:216 stop:611 length:396 start_codon:yes stop_codon:yes gene_type:complete